MNSKRSAFSGLLRRVGKSPVTAFVETMVIGSMLPALRRDWRSAPADQLSAQMQGARIALRHGSVIPLLQPAPATSLVAVRGALHASA